MERISKTRRKGRLYRYCTSEKELWPFADEQISQIDLPEEILNAVKLARTITKHGGRKRQTRYIGSLMKRIDIVPVEEAVRILEEKNGCMANCTSTQKSGK